MVSLVKPGGDRYTERETPNFEIKLRNSKVGAGSVEESLFHCQMVSLLESAS